MKKLFVSLLFSALFCLAAGAQSPQIVQTTYNNYFNQTYVFNQAGVSQPIPAANFSYHKIIFQPAPPFTSLASCQVQVDVSVDSINWSGTAIGSTNCTAQGSTAINTFLNQQQFNWVRLDVTALSGGPVYVTYNGRDASYSMGLLANSLGQLESWPVIMSAMQIQSAGGFGEPGAGNRDSGAGWTNGAQFPVLTTSGNSGPISTWFSGFAFDACEFHLIPVTVTGSTPTLDLYVQDSIDNVHWNDRLHFTQVTAAGAGQYGGISAFLTQPIAPIQSLALAAGSKVDGPIGNSIRFNWVVGGGTPSFTVTFGMWCH